MIQPHPCKPQQLNTGLPSANRWLPICPRTITRKDRAVLLSSTAITARRSHHTSQLAALPSTGGPGRDNRSRSALRRECLTPPRTLAPAVPAFRGYEGTHDTSKQKAIRHGCLHTAPTSFAGASPERYLQVVQCSDTSTSAGSAVHGFPWGVPLPLGPTQSEAGVSGDEARGWAGIYLPVTLSCLGSVQRRASHTYKHWICLSTAWPGILWRRLHQRYLPRLTFALPRNSRDCLPHFSHGIFAEPHSSLALLA